MSVSQVAVPVTDQSCASVDMLFAINNTFIKMRLVLACTKGLKLPWLVLITNLSVDGAVKSYCGATYFFLNLL